MQSISLKCLCGYRIVNGVGIDKIVLYLLEFCCSWLCYANAKFLKTLPGVGRYNGGIKVFCKRYCKRGLAACGGPGYNNYCFALLSI